MSRLRLPCLAVCVLASLLAAPLLRAQPAAPVIIDNTDSGVTTAGTWTASTVTPGYYGSNYIHDGDAGGGKSVTYTPNLTAAASYQVYARWTAGSNRATNATYTITYSGGSATVTENQQVANGQWVLLGTYSFNAGTGGNVKVSDTGANGYVIADAVMFCPATYIIDNTDANVSTTGSWSPSTTVPGYYGSNYFSDGNTGGGKTITYTPNFPLGGTYQVYARWTAGSNRATNATYLVNYAGGFVPVVVNQQNNNNTWVSLGTYNFNAGTGGSVTLTDAGANNFVIADAVKFAPVAAGGPPGAGWSLTYDHEFTSMPQISNVVGSKTPGFLPCDYYNGHTIGDSIMYDCFPGIDTGYMPFSVSAGSEGVNVLNITGNPTPNGMSAGGEPYVSGELTTAAGYPGSTDIQSSTPFSQTYGYFECRAKLPTSQGIGYWPGFWLLPANGDQSNTEYDIFEVLGNAPNDIHQTSHWNHYGNVEGYDYVGPNTSTGFHTYGFEWDAANIRWYVDGVLTKTFANRYNSAMFVLFSLQIGGSWPGDPNAQTVFPGSYQIEYLRVYSGGNVPVATASATAGTLLIGTNNWTFSSSGQNSYGYPLQENGTTVAQAVAILNNNGTPNYIDATGAWYSWNGSSGTQIFPATVGTTPVAYTPSGSLSAGGTTWSFGSTYTSPTGYAILKNGTSTGTNAVAIFNLNNKGGVAILNGLGVWSEWNGSAWVAIPAPTL